jgi:hypothetical protein
MKLIARKAITNVLPGGDYRPGDTFEVSDHVAHSLIKDGFAEPEGQAKAGAAAKPARADDQKAADEKGNARSADREAQVVTSEDVGTLPGATPHGGDAAGTREDQAADSDRTGHRASKRTSKGGNATKTASKRARKH